MHRRLLTGFALLVILPHVLAAQAASGSLDVGTAFLTQPAIGSSNVLTVAGTFAAATSRQAIALDGVAARTPNDLYTGQGVLTVSRYAPPLTPMRWEIAATASAFGVSGVAPSFGWRVLAREHVGGPTGDAFAGITAGGIDQAGSSWRVLGAHAGGLLRLGADELSGALAYTDATPRSAPAGALGYGDLFGYWDHREGGVDLLVGGGVRARARGSLGSAGWASAAATLWMTSRLALVASGGRALEDVTRGVPSVRYLSLAIRVGERRASDPTPLPVHHADPDRNDGHLEVRATGDSMRLVTVRADTATAVELMADFTDWEPVPLARAPNGAWSIERPISPGVHHVAIRINGGVWRPPPNLARAPDEFGGEIGLLAVP